MLIFRFLIIFCVTTRIGLHALILKNLYIFSQSLVLPHCIHPLSETLGSAPEYPEYLISQLPQAWANFWEESSCAKSILKCQNSH